MTINHNDVYDFLHGLRKNTGIDLISQPKMVGIHGKTYPTIGNHLLIDNEDDWGSAMIHIPHENGYLTQIESAKFRGKFVDSSVSGLVPGTHKTKSGLLRNTFQPANDRPEPSGGYYSMNHSGVLKHSTRDTTHIHDFLSKLSELPSPDGRALDFYSRKGNYNIPREQLQGFNVSEAAEHLRGWHTGITMPKGTEHHLAVVNIPQVSETRNSSHTRYLYDIGSESLKEVPQEMRTKAEDVA
jgi:hypothetical protein